MITIINNNNRNELFLIEMKFFKSFFFLYAKWFLSKGIVTGAWLKK